MSDPTIEDLYLAYRQAKTALYFERRGVGLSEIARFEDDLPARLEALRPKLLGGQWFDGLVPGEVWVVPKRIDSPEQDDDVIRIGFATDRQARVLDVQLRLSPTPEFAIAEVLYLRKFGPDLEAMLTRNSVGYRLDLRDGELDPYRRWLFDYWPRRYHEFRSVPLHVAKSALDRGASAVVIVSADLASFYDSVDPSFLVSSAFIEALSAQGAQDIAGYLRATSSLVAAYARFRRVGGRRLGVDLRTGIPIGALTSRVVANLSLATLDRFVRARPGVLEYRRYVDDLVIVAECTSEGGKRDVLGRFLPLLPSNEAAMHLDVTALARAGSEFQIQLAKVRVHHLTGAPGADFVKAVLDDFDRIVSRSTSFLDITTLLKDAAGHLIRAGNAERSPLRVLRDADRTRLERLALSSSLGTLERASVLVSPAESRRVVRRTLARVNRTLTADDDWVEGLEASFRLLRLAICTGDWPSFREMNTRMEGLFGTVRSLRSTLKWLRFRGELLDRPHAWIWLRNYLHARRLEACASAVRYDTPIPALRAGLSPGLRNRSGVVGPLGLQRRARALARADLRSFDREDDVGLNATDAAPDWMEHALSASPDLSERLRLARKFLQHDVDGAWRMPPARLFLCTRPPSYFDVARRLLLRVDFDGFRAEVFEELLQVVNALRGTSRRIAVGSVRDEHTVHIPWELRRSGQVVDPPNPRLVLGNLPVPLEHWEAAVAGTPVLTARRLAGLVRVLNRAEAAARDATRRAVPLPTLLVLPELSVPRAWFRSLARHIVRHGRLGAIVGLEYARAPNDPTRVFNQAFAVIPGPYGAAAVWPWTKRLPAHHERVDLAKWGMRFARVSSRARRTVVDTTWGRFSVLICSELLETRRVADLLTRAEVVLCPAWNPDTASYDHLIQSVGFQLHAIIGVANNGHYSDCRAWAPLTERWERDLCRLIERNVEDVVYVDLPLQSLREFHERGPSIVSDEPPAKRGGWRPLPPDWRPA